jgi:Flp pilus assembly protein TadB
LVVFLLVILFILLHYPIVLSPNIVSHTIIFSLYFLSNAALYTVLSLLGPGLILTVGYAMQVATLAALGAWLVLLQPAREKRPARQVSEMPREQELIDQLSNLNQALLRAIRK